ncbi:MAG: LysM peptidoglycan-binding domain-containing protein [Desulfitobacterium hafniense]|nr:LysM peptidoglycan-binding domain-containing protein [Desulfitobacterium hafniense]
MINRRLRKARLRKQSMILARKTMTALLCSSIVIIVFYTLLLNKNDPAFAFQPVVVEVGDTIWELAQKSNLSLDTRTIVHNIIEYNYLSDSTIKPGQVLYIPVPTKNSTLVSSRYK